MIYKLKQSNNSNVINIDTKNQKVQIKRYRLETKKIKDIDTTFDQKDFFLVHKYFLKWCLTDLLMEILIKLKNFIKPSVFKNFKLQ